MAIAIDVQYAARTKQVPARQTISRWARMVLADRARNSRLTIRIAGKEEVVELNRKWRHKNSATNVLAFPSGEMEKNKHRLLGDIVICAPVIENEAREQGKLPEAHYAHMVIHGVLHLLGYDHHGKDDAREMEAMERVFLAHLGFSDPYLVE